MLHSRVREAFHHRRRQERMGFRREALFVQSEKREATWIDSVVRSTLADEWERKRHPSG